MRACVRACARVRARVRACMVMVMVMAMMMVMVMAMVMVMVMVRRREGAPSLDSVGRSLCWRRLLLRGVAGWLPPMHAGVGWGGEGGWNE